MKRSEKINVTWSSDKQNVKKEIDRFCLNEILVRVLVKRVRENHGAGKVIETTVTGYTRATITTNDS
jgi:hypothetical protein